MAISQCLGGRRLGGTLSRMTEPTLRAIDILRGLYPSLTEEELIEADEKFGRYLQIALEICDALTSESNRGAPDADEAGASATDVLSS